MKHIDYQRLSKSFRMKEDWNDEEPLRLNETEAVVYNLAFASRNAHYLLGSERYRCEEHGVEFTEEPEDRPYGIDAGFRDPSGNSVRLTQVRPMA